MSLRGSVPEWGNHFAQQGRWWWIESKREKAHEEGEGKKKVRLRGETQAYGQSVSVGLSDFGSDCTKKLKEKKSVRNICLKCLCNYT